MARDLPGVEVECPRCGCGPELKPEWKPMVRAELGDSRRMQCRICGHQWLHKLTAETVSCRAIIV